MSIVRIKNAVFYAYHGALKEEQSIGGKFEADVEMHFDFSAAAENDELEKTINYVDVYKIINDLIHKKRFNLIETLATEIADNLLLKIPLIEKLTVRIRKNSVPIGGLIDSVEAEVTKENEK